MKHTAVDRRSTTEITTGLFRATIFYNIQLYQVLQDSHYCSNTLVEFICQCNRTDTRRGYDTIIYQLFIIIYHAIYRAIYRAILVTR